MNFIDLRTIMFVSFVQILFLGIIFLFFSRIRKKHPGTLEFAYSLLIISISLVFYFFQDPSRPFITIVIANTIFIGGLVFTPYAIRKFTGVDPIPGYYSSVVLATFVIAYYNTIVEHDNIRLRLFLIGLFTSALYLESSYLLYRYATGVITKLARLSSALYFIMAIQYASRVYFSFFGSSVSFNMMGAVGGFEKAIYGVNTIVSMICTVSVLTLFIMMVNLKMENELAGREYELKKYAAGLEKSATAKNKFISIISNDLKRPVEDMTKTLSNIIGKAAMPENLTIEMDILNKTAESLSVLLSNLLDWAKAQAGGIELSPEIIDLSEAVSESVKLLEIQAMNKKITMITRDIKNKSFMLDRKTFKTVIQNLISNAIKFTREGGRIVISAQQDAGGDTTIKISDNGVGIQPEKLRNLFSLDRSGYFSAGTAGETGTGLGLLICREFVELNGGSISVESEPEKGTTVVLTLPDSNGYTGA